MTQDEIRNFWAIGSFLAKSSSKLDDPQAVDEKVIYAKTAYEELKSKIVEELVNGDNDAIEEKLDVESAVNKLDEVVVAFATVATSLVPALANDPTTRKIIANGKLASEWLHKNMDSFKSIDV